MQPGPAPARRPGPRPVVAVRIPRVSLRFPTLLDRYIIRRYLGFLVLILAGFVSIFLLAEFMDLFDEIQHNNVKGKVFSTTTRSTSCRCSSPSPRWRCS